ESPPPDTPIKTVSPPASIAWRRMKSSTRARSFTSPPLEAHPYLAILEVLFLPDRHRLLQGVDGEFAGVERLASMSGRHSDEHTRFPDRQPARPVLHGHPPNAGPARANDGGDFAHLDLGHGRVGFVFEELDAAAAGLVAHDAREDHDAAGARVVHESG